MKQKENQLTPDDIRRQVKSLASKEYVASDYLQLFQEVFEAQFQTEEKLNVNDVCPPITREEIDRRIGQGLPIIAVNRIRLNETELGELFEKISSALARFGTGKKSAVEKFSEARRSGEISLKNLALAVIDDGYLNKVSEKVGVGREETFFLAQALVTPFLRTCARSLKDKVNLDKVVTNRCPICGGAPLMAMLRKEDGKRILECSLCAARWPFQRLKCLFCGNENADTLGFFFVEEEAAYRVDKCDKCKGYIKTVDERKKPEGALKALPVEDVVTLYLDILAAKEGYWSIRGKIKTEPALEN